MEAFELDVEGGIEGSQRYIWVQTLRNSFEALLYPLLSPWVC